ncbi:NUDIX hydrolase [Planomonospora sp. ID67723]|uniref:NUDIX domain-containing protein n=1 Tax=Planomonospora sp. ID67723 TaxID=2738134 RepID=UPI001E5E15EE|nr:NUDIX hydrolase [Planomonospora sp. ID67723]
MTGQETPPMATPRAAAGALFFDEHGRLLLVRPHYKDYRDVPGGYIEPGETPFQACVREVHEELGIQPPIGDLLVVDWAPHPQEGDKVLFLFDGGILSPSMRDSIRLGVDELAGYDFHPVEELPGLLIERLATRITAAVTARSLGRPLYLEHGQQLPN